MRVVWVDMMKPKMMIMTVQRTCVRLVEGIDEDDGCDDGDDNDEVGDGDGGDYDALAMMKNYENLRLVQRAIWGLAICTC